MENNTFQQFFEVLSSKIIGCFLSKNKIYKLSFLKFESRIIIDSQTGLDKKKYRALGLFATVLLCFTGITSWAQNMTTRQNSSLKTAVAYTDAYINKVTQPWTTIYTQQNAIKQTFTPEATGLSSGFRAVKPQTANLDQIRNGLGATSVTPSVAWVNGNLNASQAHYAEGWSIPYRMVMKNLTTGAHELIIEWDIKHSGKNALDYITSYDNMDNPGGSHNATFGHTQETIDPTIGVSGLGTPTTFEILPAPSSAGSPVTGMPTNSFNALPATKRNLTIYNGTITGITYVSQGNLTAAQSATRLKITFTTTDPTVVIAWGGHIAAEYDWGEGSGATAVDGSPYHTRLVSLDGAGGNQDRSLAAKAVVSPPTCSILDPGIICPDATSVDISSSILNDNGVTVTYLWALNGGNTAGAMIDASGATGSSITVVPIDTGTGFTPGTFDATLTVTRNGSTNTCSRTVTINSLPAAPTLKIIDVSLCGDSSTGSIEVCNPIDGTYKLYLNDVLETQIVFPDVPAIFSGLAAGSNPSVTVTNTNGCTSLPASCDGASADDCPAPAPLTAKTAKAVAPTEAKTEKVVFEAYPVPFKDQLTIRYNFDYASKVKIEVFDSQGNLVLFKTDTNSYLNKEIALDLKLNRGRDQVYVVKVTTNRGSSTKKVISSR